MCALQWSTVGICCVYFMQAWQLIHAYHGDFYLRTETVPILSEYVQFRKSKGSCCGLLADFPKRSWHRLISCRYSALSIRRHHFFAFEGSLDACWYIRYAFSFSKILWGTFLSARKPSGRNDSSFLLKHIGVTTMAWFASSVKCHSGGVSSMSVEFQFKQWCW